MACRHLPPSSARPRECYNYIAHSTHVRTRHRPKRGHLTQVVSIGTYIPRGTIRDSRVHGPDEDALTMAVAAGRAADPHATAQRVVLVSRDFPLLEGGNGAVLLAALSLPADVPGTETLGGAPVLLDQIAGAGAGTLVIAADD